MMRSMTLLSNLKTVWRRLEGHLATNSPHLWGLQIHIVIPAAVCGLLLSIILKLVSPHLLGAGPWFVGFAFLLQTYFFVAWVMRLSFAPRPSNVVAYSSPPLLAVLLCIAIILVSPAIVLTQQLEDLNNKLGYAVYFLAGETFLIAAAHRFVGGMIPQNTQSLIKAALGSLFLLSILFGLVAWLIPGFVNLMAFTVCLFAIGASRLIFCLVSGVRRVSDAMWISVILLLPVALSAGYVMELRLGGADLVDVAGRYLTSLYPGILWFGGGVLLLLAIVWIDLVSAVRIRFMMLPVRE
jgi:hypothetical protein